MKILIADDDTASREILRRLLVKWNHDVLVTCDGREAWDALRGSPEVGMAILDWMMPGISGVDVCKLAREEAGTLGIYIILLTSLNEKEHIVTGLRAGADDYLTKPFDFEELRARIHVGARILDLQNQLSERVRELEQALGEIRILKGLIPICSYCKNIRDDQNYWHRVEEYVARTNDARFTHGICPECLKKLKGEGPGGSGSRTDRWIGL